MERLLMLTASDGSSLLLGEDPAGGLVFEHDHGAPEPVEDGFAVVWPIIDHSQHVVFAGDVEPGVDCVEIRVAHESLSCRVREARGRHVWMSFPTPVETVEGAVATASYLAGARVMATRQTAPLRSPWAGYAPVEQGSGSSSPDDP